MTLSVNQAYSYKPGIVIIGGCLRSVECSLCVVITNKEGLRSLRVYRVNITLTAC